MAKTRFEADSLKALVVEATDNASGDVLIKDVPFDHDDTKQISVKVLDSEAGTQLYFNAYQKGDGLWFCGQPQEAAISTKKKALKGYEPISGEVADESTWLDEAE